MKRLKIARFKDKKGFSLVEVLVSIVLVALLATFVAVFMAYWQTVRTQSNELTKSLNKVQQIVEEKYSEARKYIRGNNTEWLEANTEQSSVTLFGRQITVYKVSAEVKDDKGATVIALSRGIANTYRGTPAIPQIASVTIKANNAEVDAVYFADSTSSAVIKEPIPLSVTENFKRFMYQWYATRSVYHVLPLKGETVKSEGNVVPGCPINFFFLSGEEELSLSNLAQYKGGIIACLATPGSKQGYMGDSVCSNYIYVSPLPTLETGTYFALFDPSLLSYNDGYMINDIVNDTLVLSPIPSELAYKGTTITLSHIGKVYLNTAGSNTAGAYAAVEYMSRYMRYTAGNYSKTQAYTFNAGQTAHVFAVARNTNGKPGTYFHTAPSGPILSYAPDENGEISDGWLIQHASAALPANPVTFYMGSDNSANGMDVDIAETLVVINPSDTDVTAIMNYLKVKYGITG